MSPIDSDRARWPTHTEVVTDTIALAPVSGLAALLDRDEQYRVGDAVPPLAHWLFFQRLARQSGLGADGHPRRGQFLPPIDLPRRMWAGGGVEFLAALRVGDIATRTSRVSAVTEKQGRSGPLVLVDVEHEIRRDDTLLIRETQTLVYRGHDGLAPREPREAGRSTANEPAWRREIHPDPVMLFRYSALTGNSHRIHYDRPYAREIEGYPALVVQAPLIATLLLDFATASLPGKGLQRFEFRAERPLFDGVPVTLCGRAVATGASEVALWALDRYGTPAFRATASMSGAA